jgi:hypothetical protein
MKRKKEKIDKFWKLHVIIIILVETDMMIKGTMHSYFNENLLDLLNHSSF